MIILKASKEGRGRGTHTHVAYLDEEGYGTTSFDQNHMHAVSPDTSVTEMPDGSFIQAPPGQPIVAEANNHTHLLAEFSLSPPGVSGETDDIITDVKGYFELEQEVESESIKKAEESEDFLKSEQWEYKQKLDLLANDRAALTINEVEAKLDLLSGYQRQNRSDIKYFPVEGGDGKVADILNIVVKNILDQNDYEFQETEVFDDESTVGRGFINVYESYDKNIDGDIIVERYPWKAVTLGPHEKLDISDLEHLCKYKWMSKEKLKQLWPDKADRIDTEYDFFFPGDEVPKSMQDDNYQKTRETRTIDARYVDKGKKEFLVIECWRKEYIKVPILIDPANDYYENIYGMSDADISKFETIEQLAVVKLNQHRMRLTTIASSILLDDEYPELPEQDFQIIPVYAKKKGNLWWGKVEGAKDPQREINKRHSQAVDIMNKVAAYGWFYDNDTFPNPREKERFRKKSSKPGFLQQISNIGMPPHLVEGVKFPSEIANMMAADSEKIRQIMNINVELLGQDNRAQSGVALVEQKRQGLIGNEFLFDNLNRAKKKLGKLMVAYIRKLYTPERIMRVLGSVNQQTPVQVGQQEFDSYPPEEIQSLLENDDLTKYDVAVAQSGFNPTQRMANFTIWAELAQTGYPVPPAFLIDLSDLPEKEKAKQAMAQEAQQRQQEEDKKSETEIQKTVIAQQGKLAAAQRKEPSK